MKPTVPVLVVRAGDEALVQSLLQENGFEGHWIDATESPPPLVLAELKRFGLDTFDSLTGLRDRKSVLARLDELTAWPEGDPLWAVLIDLDHFKQVNDLFGHMEGDNVLIGVGGLLRVPRPEVIVAGRFGGEEFFVLLQAPEGEAMRALEDVKASFSTLRLPDGRAVTASFGVSFFRPGDSSQDLLSRADKNLYQAKCDGRNRIVTETGARGSVSDFDLELKDYENRVKVFADRMVANLTSRGRKMVLSLRDEADHDGLTGLFNRRHFDRRLERELERSRDLRSPLSMLLLDLDDFGAVNRDYGYPAGDEALRTAAATLQRGIRVIDWAARYGGEELCGVFPDTDTATAAEIAQRIRQGIQDLKPQGVDGRHFRITASIGVVTLNDGDASIAHFVQRAGIAVRRSKTEGKNRVTVG